MDDPDTTSRAGPEGVERPTIDPEVQRLNEQLHAAHKRVNELAHALQAGERDRLEFKQRLTRERDRILDTEKGNVASILLDAVDQLDRCLQAAAAAAASPLAKGVQLIRESMLKQAESIGVERVELLGTAFDPNLAEATDMEVTPLEAEDRKVIAVLKACYQLKGRVIRPGVVKVAKYVKPAAA